jgi:hypothetical protein
MYTVDEKKKVARKMTSLYLTTFSNKKHGGNMVFEIITYVALISVYIFHECTFKYLPFRHFSQLASLSNLLAT